MKKAGTPPSAGRRLAASAALTIIAAGDMMAAEPLSPASPAGQDLRIEDVRMWRLVGKTESGFARSGDAARLDYRLPADRTEAVTLQRADPDLRPSHRVLRLRARGDMLHVHPVAVLVDRNGGKHATPLHRVRGRERAVYQADLDRFKRQWDGADRVAFPLRALRLVFWRLTPEGRSGRILLSNLTALTKDERSRADLETFRSRFADAGRRARQAVREAGNARMRENLKNELGRLRDRLREGDSTTNHPQRLSHSITALEARAACYEAERAAHGCIANLYGVALVSPMAKVRPDVPFAEPCSQAVSLSAARGETELAQLLVVPPLGSTNPVSIITAGNGLNIEVRRIDCVRVSHPTRENGETGWWPDILMPYNRNDPLAGDRLQTYLIVVNVPRNAHPGTRKGSIHAAGHSLSMTVRVRDFQLPEKNPLKVAAGLDTDRIERFYGGREMTPNDLLCWIRFLGRYGLHAGRRAGSYHGRHWRKVLTPPPDWMIREQLEVAPHIWAGRISQAHLRGKLKKERREAETLLLDRLPEVEDRLASQGWLKDAYFYGYDEIRNEREYRVCAELYEKMKKAAPQIKILQVLGAEPVPRLDPWVDVWCQHVRRYARNPSFFDEKMAEERETWWYFTKHGSPWPGLAIDSAPIHHRILPLQSFKFGFAGLLHWETVAFPPSNYRSAERWPEAAWQASYLYNNGNNWYNGNGQLVYPGPNFEPVPSLRLEMLRQGMEDTLYLEVLRRRLDHAAIPSRLGAKTRKALKIDFIRNVADFERNPAALHRAREHWGRLIEVLQ